MAEQAQLTLERIDEFDEEALRAECNRVLGPADVGTSEGSTVTIFIGERQHVFKRSRIEYARRAAIEFLRPLPAHAGAGRSWDAPAQHPGWSTDLRQAQPGWLFEQDCVGVRSVDGRDETYDVVKAGVVVACEEFVLVVEVPARDGERPERWRLGYSDKARVRPPESEVTS
jgi:hypothetical protein